MQSPRAGYLSSFFNLGFFLNISTKLKTLATKAAATAPSQVAHFTTIDDAIKSHAASAQSQQEIAQFFKKEGLAVKSIVKITNEDNWPASSEGTIFCNETFYLYVFSDDADKEASGEQTCDIVLALRCEEVRRESDEFGDSGLGTKEITAASSSNTKNNSSGSSCITM